MRGMRMMMMLLVRMMGLHHGIGSSTIASWSSSSSMVRVHSSWWSIVSTKRC